MTISKNDSTNRHVDSVLHPDGDSENKKVTDNEPVKPAVGRIRKAISKQDELKTEKSGDEVQAENTDETTIPGSGQLKKPEGTKNGMDFANRYK